jgi:ABC-type Mn2+/Zn2+ transport system ATPase subunit
MGLWKELSKTERYIRRKYSDHAAGEPIVRLEAVGLRYETGYALCDLSLTLQDGERLAVVGPNGAGKSTLFKMIAGVVEPSEGRITIRGAEPGGHICIGYVPQRSQVDWSFPATVADTVMMGRTDKIGLLRFPSRRDWQVVNAALETVGLTAYARRQISQLSGGQQQRMFIARALAQEAELVLMDEPFTGLDAAALEELFAILDALRARGVTVMVALHDLEIAARRFDRALLLNRRVVGLGTPEETFTPERLVEAYGGRLRVLPGAQPLLALDDTCCGGEHEHGADELDH